MTANERRLSDKCDQQARQIEKQSDTIERYKRRATASQAEAYRMTVENERLIAVNAKLRRGEE